jgi:hypothetical protein
MNMRSAWWVVAESTGLANVVAFFSVKKMPRDDSKYETEDDGFGKEASQALEATYYSSDTYNTIQYNSWTNRITSSTAYEKLSLSGMIWGTPGTSRVRRCRAGKELIMFNFFVNLLV